MQKLILIAKALNSIYPEGNDVFKITTRLLEESGEIAKEVNHIEKTGMKVEKYGEPNLNNLANEIHHTIRCVLQLAIYYNIEDLLYDSINTSYDRLMSKGYIK